MISTMKLAFISYMSIVFSTIIFCRQIGKFLVLSICISICPMCIAEWSVRALKCACLSGHPRAVITCRPKMGLNNQKFENLIYEYPAFDA